MNPRATFFEADICDAAEMNRIFASFRPEWVSHQAAQMSVSRSVREPAFDAQVNLVGLCNVMSAAVAAGTTRVSFASSGGVMYGDVTFPPEEDYPANPMSPYGISKWAGERYLQFFNKQHGISAVALRYANVYGPRQNPHGEAGVVAIFSTKFLHGEAPTINGDGKYIRDYVYVQDVVAANMAALTGTSTGFEAFNIGTAKTTDVNQLAEMLSASCAAELRQAGKEIRIPAPSYGPARAGDLRSNLVSPRKAKEKLGWEPKMEIRQGLAETAAWFAQRLLTNS